MDIFSHGLWGAGAFGRKSKRDFKKAFFWGVFPDLFSFGIFTVITTLGFATRPDFSGQPTNDMVPQYIHILYNLTHSFIIFAIIFGIVWLIKKRPYYLMLGWPLHILFDIGTHSTQFFPTPFLWPLISYRFDGVSWSSPQIFIPNLVFLAILYAGWWISRLRKARQI